MKKLLTMAALMGVTSLSFGQGMVNFINGTTSRFSTNSFLTAGNGTGGSSPALAAAAPAGSYLFELLVAPSGTAATVPGVTNGIWVDTGVLGASQSSAGRMAGYTFSDSTGSLIPGYGTSATANFAVFAWSANVGTTFAEALAAWNNGAPKATGGTTGAYFFEGLSGVANNIALAPPGGPYNNIWGSTVAGSIPGMVLGVFAVPEPGTMALAGLGAASLLIFRRRK